MEQVRALYENDRPYRATPEGPFTFEDETRVLWSVLGTPNGKIFLAILNDICTAPPLGANEVHDHARLAFYAGLQRPMHELNRRLAGRGAPRQQGTENE